LRAELKRLFAIGLTHVPLSASASPDFIQRDGRDFTKFRSASTFASWLGPDNDVGGGKSFGSARARSLPTRRHAPEWLTNPSTTAKAASGASIDLCERNSVLKAMTAAAHKLARIIFPPDHNWSRPDVYDGGLRKPGLLGHEPRAPVRTVDRHRLQRSRDHVLDLGVRN
jgi:hypothetical protein